MDHKTLEKKSRIFARLQMAKKETKNEEWSEKLNIISQAEQAWDRGDLEHCSELLNRAGY